MHCSFFFLGSTILKVTPSLFLDTTGYHITVIPPNPLLMYCCSLLKYLLPMCNIFFALGLISWQFSTICHSFQSSKLHTFRLLEVGLLFVYNRNHVRLKKNSLFGHRQGTLNSILFFSSSLGFGFDFLQQYGENEAVSMVTCRRSPTVVGVDCGCLPWLGKRERINKHTVLMNIELKGLFCQLVLIQHLIVHLDSTRVAYIIHVSGG